MNKITYKKFILRLNYLQSKGKVTTVGVRVKIIINKTKRIDILARLLPLFIFDSIL